MTTPSFLDDMDKEKIAEKGTPEYYEELALEQAIEDWHEKRYRERVKVKEEKGQG